MKALVTGAKGFVAGYLIQELLAFGWEVVGVDNLSKYGDISKTYDAHPSYRFVKGDAKDAALLKECLKGCDHFVAGAAMVGGVTSFSELAYDFIAENERITVASFDAAIEAYKHDRLKKITLISSSMVFENATRFPTAESEVGTCPPPTTTYGFQKLALDYFARGAHAQYGLPYTIVRLSNCIGVGEKKPQIRREINTGNIKLVSGHVISDLIQKVLKGQEPLHIFGDGSQVRHYTYGGDLAQGIRMALENEKAMNEDFNLATSTSTTVLELAALIWKKIYPEKPFKYVCESSFPGDVRLSIPDTTKARNILGFNALTTLDQSLDEIIPWVKEQMQAGSI
jgi:UDP-glucose 4-epimerase